ncbi:MAG: bifunctional serine/threonine-protein kinase/formylglycine-generating enzyme family protein [Kiritimatiellae bacterium]|nr:bifunctional serine/threonine-protein kinase/formylglycine-generating enzyme family protein [Kiritimatiellia bacterium]
MSAEDLVGSTIGSYRVLRRLGAGGMGVVYEVEHAQLGVRYALKVFPFEGQKGEFLRKRFVAEGKILARLSVPGVVRVYDMGTTETFAWFTMDCVLGADGEPHTLADVPQTGESPEDTVIGWYEDVRQALEGVHAAGVVHRDVKLENVLIDSEGKAKLGDFGISRVKDESLRAEIALTRTMVTGTSTDARIVLGTVAYMAPEMRTGGEAAPATDCYALGVAFFRLLTGIWYEPGPRAFDLLAPFDKRWREVLGALLATDPAKRTLMPFRTGRRKTLRRFILGAALGSVCALPLIGGLHYCRHEPNATHEKEVVAQKGALPQMSLALTNGVAIDLIQCPAGKFVMGKVFADQVKHQFQNGDPQLACAAAKVREVLISRPFWMSKTPITWEQFKVVTGDTSWCGAGAQEMMGGRIKWPKWSAAVEAMGGDKSMFFGNALAACRFLEMLNDRYASKLPPGTVFRLASEAEWEYALTAGTPEVDNPFLKVKLTPEDEGRLGTGCEQWTSYLKSLHLEMEEPKEWFDDYFCRYCPPGLPAANPPNAWGFHDFRRVDEWVNDVIMPIVRTESTWDPLHRVEKDLPSFETDPLKYDRSSTICRRLVRTSGRNSHEPRMFRWAKNERVHLAAFRLVIGPDLVKELQEKQSKGE